METWLLRLLSSDYSLEVVFCVCWLPLHSLPLGYTRIHLFGATGTAAEIGMVYAHIESEKLKTTQVAALWLR